MDGISKYLLVCWLLWIRQQADSLTLDNLVQVCSHQGLKSPRFLLQGDPTYSRSNQRDIIKLWTKAGHYIQIVRNAFDIKVSDWVMSNKMLHLLTLILGSLV